MTSISGTGGSLGSLTSYCTQLLAAKADNASALDASATSTGLTVAEGASLTGTASTGSDAGALSTLLGSGSPGGSLASLLGGSFTDTNTLLSQISVLANGSSTTGNGATGAKSSGGASTASATGGTSQQRRISSLLAGVFQTEQQDFLSLFI